MTLGSFPANSTLIPLLSRFLEKFLGLRSFDSATSFPSGGLCDAERNGIVRMVMWALFDLGPYNIPPPPTKKNFTRSTKYISRICEIMENSYARIYL